MTAVIVFNDGETIEAPDLTIEEILELGLMLAAEEEDLNSIRIEP